MNGSHAGLRLAARASEPNEEPDTQPEPEGAKPKDKKKEDEMSDSKTHTIADVEKAAADAATAATLAASERFNAVLASEHYAGREPLAQKLLGNVSLSAADIIDMLQAAEKKPDAESSEMSDEDKRRAAEEGGRQEMREQLGKDRNSTIDADGGTPGDKAKARAAGLAAWDTVIAEMK